MSEACQSLFGQTSLRALMGPWHCKKMNVAEKTVSFIFGTTCDSVCKANFSGHLIIKPSKSFLR